MKPAVCYLCGKSALEDNSGKKGDWVEFEDYSHEDADSLSHPIGLEYFCSEHFSEANRLKHKKSNEALAKLEGKFPPAKSSEIKTSHKSFWWQR